MNWLAQTGDIKERTVLLEAIFLNPRNPPIHEVVAEKKATLTEEDAERNLAAWREIPLPKHDVIQALLVEDRAVIQRTHEQASAKAKQPEGGAVRFYTEKESEVSQTNANNSLTPSKKTSKRNPE